MQQDILSGLKKVPFLSHLPEQDLSALASQAKTGIFPKQSFIITEGDETASLHFLISGAVRVYTSDDHGKEVTLSIQEPGSYFGELALLDNQPRSVSVVTKEKTICGTISKSDFKSWLVEHPDAAFGLIQDLSRKVRDLTSKVKDMALSNVYERTIKVLKEMSTEKNGVVMIDRKLTQQELANMVGSSREMINKIMKELTKGGYISCQTNYMTINKKFPSAW